MICICLFCLQNSNVSYKSKFQCSIAITGVCVCVSIRIAGMGMHAMRWMLLLLMFVPQIALFTGGDATSLLGGSRNRLRGSWFSSSSPFLSSSSFLLKNRGWAQGGLHCLWDSPLNPSLVLDAIGHDTTCRKKAVSWGHGTTGVVKLPVIGSMGNNVGL